MDDSEIAYEGKAKQLILLDNVRERYLQRFKNDATAFNGEKFAQFEGKGALNNAMSIFLFERLEQAGIDTHYIEQRSATDMLIEKLEMVPLEVVVRNHVAGSLGRRTGLKEGSQVDPPIVETYYKKDELGDPILADVHVKVLDLIDAEGLVDLKESALRINDVLLPIFGDAGIRLVDFKLEFGYGPHGNLVLGDEISPDTSRLWDMETNDSLDKDVFRYDKANLVEAYQEVANRLGVSVGG